MHIKLGCKNITFLHPYKVLTNCILAYFLSSLKSECSMDCSIDNKILKRIATQILLTEKPSSSLSAKRIIKALIISKNNPNVSTVIGSVNITNIGLTNRFSTASTIATMIADTNSLPDNSTPGKK